MFFSHGNLSVTNFCFIHRRHPYRTTAVASWQNCLILAEDIRGFSAKRKIKIAVDFFVVNINQLCWATGCYQEDLARAIAIETQWNQTRLDDVANVDDIEWTLEITVEDFK